MATALPSIAVVIPCYRVRDHITDVINSIGPLVKTIYCVDDHCPDESGNFIKKSIKDRRIRVLTHAARQGVGGAMITGYEAALHDQMDIVVKLDGDGQMDATLIPTLIEPILRGQADYAKGNRFYRIEDLRQMPYLRLIGNAVLSFFSKASTGYWDLFDPTNGFTAIHGKVLAMLPLSKVSRSYFFESDMLFRLNTLRAVVTDVPMRAIYGDEISHLRIGKAVPEFMVKHVINFIKRIFYNHFLRGFDMGSLYLTAAVPMFLFGLGYGLYRWIEGAERQVPATAGTVMLAGLPFLLSIQFLVSFIHHDILDIPRTPLNTRM